MGVPLRHPKIPKIKSSMATHVANPATYAFTNSFLNLSVV